MDSLGTGGQAGKPLRKACVCCGKEFEDGDTLCPDDGTLLTPLVQQTVVGAIIADKYEVLEVIGDGGMGMVFRAKHLLMKRIVAIKMLHPHLVSSAGALKRFQKEAEALSALNHPNILTVFDFGLTAQGNPFLVMDFLEGKSLGSELGESEHLDVQRALPIFIQTCAGLAHAHQKGVIHRDLKPANIMLIDFEGQSDFVKIVDFGIAKIVPQTGEESSQLTNTGEVFGSPLYMSPEQCRGQELDERTDIYSMGCVIYRALTGKPPLIGHDLLDCMFKQVNETPAPFASACPELGLPDELERIAFRAMAKDPGDRYQSIAEMREALESYRGAPLATLSHVSLAAPPPPPPPPEKATQASPALEAATAGEVPTTGQVLEQMDRLRTQPAKTGLDVRIVSLVLALVITAAATALLMSKKNDGGTPGTKGGPAGSESFQSAMSLSGKLLADGQYAQGLTEIDRAVSAARGFAGGDPRLSQALTAQGEARYDLGDYAGAQSSLEEALKLRQAVAGGQSPEAAETLNVLGRVYTAREQYAQAEDALKQALAIRKAKFGEKSLPVADTLNALGYLDLKEGEYDAALSQLKESLDIRRQKLSETDPLVAKTMNDLGQAYQLKGDLRSAESLFRKSLSIRELKMSAKSPALAESMTTLATLCVATHKFAEAEKLYKQALAIQIQAFGEDNQLVARNYWNIGVLHYNQRRFAEAVPMLEEALRIAKHVGRMSSPSVAQIQSLLTDCKKRAPRS